ncbi:hypothetical protein LGM21_07160 [Klebsiella quasipneumoniae subsp. quasipneumoniae]|uniref:hypothetical protein n=1 Tax=Klebsiella quasipneumoniae TaxID=1463165 RepID=UPI000430EA2F|nr:hypothetical protein [Klebsiella quasipneumoniae]UDC67296.1 hypothetical protein LGM21_07160 [Klebsiella quasipneumoniae subsp. quasipneumoniae]CDN01413.1 hypothetical protein KPSB59_2750010 [Klebsiella quasipneumoniae subsp. quasipneumoniae]VGP67471.1 hypothetical protein SB00059_05168 [Klebsiella quasipneumoniae subsp. quasipneumoniae]
MTTDITELAQMKGQKVEGSYYLAECTDCGKMYPSNKLNGGEPLFCGDYGECYCPHCNADDAAIGDCGDTAATAWNYQQNRIDALVEALEKAHTQIIALQQKAEIDPRTHEIIDLKERIIEINDVLCSLLPDCRYMDPPDGGNVTPLEQVSRMIADYRQRIAELESRTVKLPPELYTIGELIRTQDNRITDQPMFVVFQKREIIGSDEHSPSRICWVWDGEEVSELRAKRLEALHQDGRDTRGYDRYAMQEVDEFVTACFTEHGCKDYLRQNGHNLRLPYIYACGSFRNNEYQLVRNWLAGIKVEAE